MEKKFLCVPRLLVGRLLDPIVGHISKIDVGHNSGGKGLMQLQIGIEILIMVSESMIV